MPNGWFHTTRDNVEQVIQDGYRVLMAPTSRRYAVLQKSMDGDRPRKACRHFLGGGGHGAEAAQRGVWLAPSSNANPAART